MVEYYRKTWGYKTGLLVALCNEGGRTEFLNDLAEGFSM